MDNLQQNIIKDNWDDLKSFTQARIALGRSGVAIPIKETLQFRIAHAHARDAVYSDLALSALHGNISDLGLDFLDLKSQASTRDEYLKRPDLGRTLHADSIALIKGLITNESQICIVVSDGLSATAVNRHVFELLEKMKNLSELLHYSWTPVFFVQNGRVAIADEIAELMKTDIVIHLIGERPGLTSFDSLSAYITYHPKKAMTDESRNCISNIRPEGLPIPVAAEKIMFMVRESFKLRLSGVYLKDTFPGQLLLG